ncbi:hypothetical protein VP01_3357g1 [Puccinia sorghi]|uniref:Uncharacterized protein n=1 Tax=Puccinia sorghi TaxID=27349 RepID=A0A0L6UX00_9BASI|nr:hypothetical protein VP01_3357g1 [Puccinia sorghi]
MLRVLISCSGFCTLFSLSIKCRITATVVLSKRTLPSASGRSYVGFWSGWKLVYWWGGLCRRIRLHLLIIRERHVLTARVLHHTIENQVAWWGCRVLCGGEVKEEGRVACRHGSRGGNFNVVRDRICGDTTMLKVPCTVYLLPCRHICPANFLKVFRCADYHVSHWEQNWRGILAQRQAVTPIHHICFFFAPPVPPSRNCSSVQQLSSASFAKRIYWNHFASPLNGGDVAGPHQPDPSHSNQPSVQHDVERLVPPQGSTHIKCNLHLPPSHVCIWNSTRGTCSPQCSVASMTLRRLHTTIVKPITPQVGGLLTTGWSSSRGTVCCNGVCMRRDVTKLSNNMYWLLTFSMSLSYRAFPLPASAVNKYPRSTANKTCQTQQVALLRGRNSLALSKMRSHRFYYLLYWCSVVSINQVQSVRITAVEDEGVARDTILTAKSDVIHRGQRAGPLPSGAVQEITSEAAFQATTISEVRTISPQTSKPGDALVPPTSNSRFLLPTIQTN